MLVVLAVAAPRTVAAQAVTAFKTGEQTTGMTKQCYYQYLSSTYTRTVSSVDLCPLTIEVEANPNSTPSTAAAPRPAAPATATAFKTGEQTTGMTKQCIYSYLASTYTRTVSSVTLCPLTIQVRTSP
jgi:predicted DNA-binding transcriptional regulator AlpA